jgi:3-methyl-2-oxobutanoate hydroxymethyltransferase
MTARRTPADIQRKKDRGEKIVMLTAYDYPLALFVDSCDVDMILVGDSLANVVLGLESTRDVDITMMLHHARAVNRAVQRALLAADLPYATCQGGAEQVRGDARRLVEEAGCQAVKIEWYDGCLSAVAALVEDGIPVIGHAGLTPQTAGELGGFKVQGKDAARARQVMEDARQLAAAGCFAVVLECVPSPLARLITSRLAVPTIGIGAGPHCDGQVLVTPDVVGLFDRFQPKFVKRYAQAGDMIKQAVTGFRDDVRNGRFPDAAHSFTMPDEELEQL